MDSGVIHSAWTSFRKSSWGQNDRLVFVGGFYAVHNIVFWGINLGLFSIDKLSLFEKYKIQKGKQIAPELLRKALIDVFVSHVILNLGLIYYLVYPLAKRRVSLSQQTPKLTTVLWQIPAFMIIEDFLFYWIHRLLHHRAIYKYVHKKHHEFKVNIGIAAEYAHPVESIFGTFFPFISGPLVFKAHFLTLLFWLAFRVTEAIDGHSGYRFPWSPFQILDRIQGGPERHEFHHSNNQGSYGSFFTFWDWVTGSDQPYRAYQIINMEADKRQTATNIPRAFSLNLAEKTDRNIALKLRDNVMNFPADHWAEAKLDGKDLQVPEDSAKYGSIELPESGRLKFTYILVGGRGARNN